MAGRQTHFVPFDPSNVQRKSRNDSRLLCQTCFKPFDTGQALRDHIGDFQVSTGKLADVHANELQQLEVQQLMARLLEAQAHLPSLDNQYHAVSDDGKNDDSGNYGGDDSSTDNDEDDGGSGDCSLGWEDPARLQCPYPVCNRKRQFNRRQDLVRHYQLRISPYTLEKKQYANEKRYRYSVLRDLCILP